MMATTVKNDVISESQNVIQLKPWADIYAKAFDKGTLLHDLEYKQVKEIVKKLKEAGKDYVPDDKRKLRRVHNTITLSGSRGSGKTSFLYTLKEDAEVKDDTLVLEIIDPTLIEEKGHIFLNIVARIKEHVDEKRESAKENSEILNAYEEWKKILKKLAAGLPLLDGIKGGLDPSDWNDTTFVMMDGLDKVNGANNLEFYFHQYIYNSLKLLDKKYLMIAFDDVDTDFSKGWPVLETLRKYLTSPQLIIFLSGDLDLYSFIVRKKQWKNFGKTLLKNEYDRECDDSTLSNNEYPELVEKLESQYMMKLLKPEYRITLSTIASKLRSNSVTIQVDNGSGHLVKIEEYYADYLAKIWGVRGKNTLNSYVTFFTSTALRSQLSLLNTFTIIDDESLSYIDRLHHISKGVSDVFHSELRIANVDVWDMLNGYGLVNVYMLKFLLHNKILDEASQFFPKLNKPIWDGAVTAMGSVLVERQFANPYEIFDFIIRVSNVVSKANWQYESADKQIPNIEDFVVHSRNLYDYGLKKIASLQSAYVVSFRDCEAKNEGLIPIKALQESNKDKRDENDLRVDELYDDSNRLCQILAILPAFGAQDRLGNTSTFYSFYNLLAAIGDVIFPTGKEMKNEFVRAGQFREYPLFTNSNEVFHGEVGGDGEVRADTPEGVSDDAIEALIFQMEMWKTKWSKSSAPFPPYLLGRIMVRTVYAFRNIDPQSSVGHLLHRQLVVFLNAILVEEVMEREGTDMLRLNNPVNSDKYFIENITKTMSGDMASRYPLFDFMFSCPLIRAYLDPDLFDEINKTTPAINLFPRLSHLNIKGGMRIERSEKAEIETSNAPSFERLPRNIYNNQADGDRVVEYLKSIGKAKDTITYWDVDRAIRVLFSNRRLYTVTVERIIHWVNISNKW